MHSSLRIAIALAAQLLFASAALAQPAAEHRALDEAVGTVADLNSTAKCMSCLGQPTPRRNQPVHVGETLATLEGGRLFINFEDRSVIKLLPHSELTVRAAQQAAQGYFTNCSLREGQVHVYVLKTSCFKMETLAGKVLSSGSPNRSDCDLKTAQIETGEATCGTVETSGDDEIRRSADFFVFYNPSNETMQVISVDGEVEVYGVGRCAGRNVTVFAHQVTTVERGQCPATPWRIDDATLAFYVEAGEFIGDGEGQTIGLGDPTAVVPGGDLPPAVKPPPFTKYGIDPRCTAPGCVLKPVFVPPGNIFVQF